MTEMQNDISTRQSILSRLAGARVNTDKLFEMVKPEALYDRPIPERHRIVFYLGHLEAFDWNLLAHHALELEPFNPTFDTLFAFGIDPVEGGLPSDQPSDWPSVAEVREYNQRVRRELDQRLEDESFGDADGTLFATGVYLNVAIEHRLMHAETFAYMLHQLPFERKVRHPSSSEPAASQAQQKRMIEIPAGTASLGLEREGRVFGWDNEFEIHSVEVPAFAIDEYKVTNAEFLKFVLEGGYEDPGPWSKEDWEWIEHEGIRQPKFWIRRGDSWFYRTMFAEVPLPLDWPVYVSHAEAAAYARWAGKQLPTEEQFHRAAYGTPEGPERPYPWGDDAPAETYGNFDFARWNPSSVSAHPAGRSAFGVADLIGNGWEWTSTLFQPFPGFEPFPFYPGYSANFFDGKHYVMKGGAAHTAACMLRRSFRNWFQPHYQYVYSGFRLASN
ncbi:MAG: SUMF1/EgtB/PvdO family nonheme iron enzyme [Acidobacteria bacterium]|nr:SUMF1/EgtB/PvdO family nonheme iron enzyme [Acidobacteriota bacterium]